MAAWSLVYGRHHMTEFGRSRDNQDDVAVAHAVSDTTLRDLARFLGKIASELKYYLLDAIES